MPPIAIILIAVTVLILISAFFIIPYTTYSIAFKRKAADYDPYKNIEGWPDPDEARKLIDRIIKEECVDLTITSRDGLHLHARYYHRADGAPIHIQCHGYKSTPLRDFSGGGIEALDMGHNLLLIHQRSHGLSEGKTISFGILERYDVVDWINLMVEMNGDDCEIILSGISMGAATVLMCADLDLPKNVKCIIADCPYSSVKEIISLVAKRMGYPARLIYPFIKLGARIYGGFNPEASSPLEAVKHAKVPILIAHGADDGFVPAEMSERIADACVSECVREVYPGAEHGMSFISDTARYREMTASFLKKYIKG